MAIGDLLWACPFCATVAAVEREGRGAASCAACGARFRRGTGAALLGMPPGGEWQRRSAAEWLRALPAVPDPIREDRVEAAIAGADEVVRRGREVLGFRETPDILLEGVLRLDASELTLVADDGTRRVWPLEEVTAIQPSSRVVQVKARGRPVATFRFKTGSPRLWEEILQAALRELWRERGWGEIREYQPRIVAR
ncbi:MAG TPA: hypothetical protein VK837_09610 [Longimicrobiales bacterium]|nr:hypothetical protein [Longimicrobiales bacterium]